MNVINNLHNLYQTDDSLWLEEIINLLKNKKFDQLDLENLIEELEDLGNEKKHRVESFLEQIIRHILLLEYWDIEKENNQAHWEAEIVNFQNQLKRYLTTNLYNHIQLSLPVVYADALRYCRKKTANAVNFPEKCPYSLDDLLNYNQLE